MGWYYPYLPSSKHFEDFFHFFFSERIPYCLTSTSSVPNESYGQWLVLKENQTFCNKGKIAGCKCEKSELEIERVLLM